MPRDEVNFNEIIPRKMLPSDDFSDFDCSNEDELGCNDFIHNENEAKLFQSERQGITYLFFYKDILVGFTTVAMSSINAERMTRKHQKIISLPYYPGLLIGRLAVGNDWRKKGIGKHICEWCVGLALELSERIGCRYVILETNDKKVTWYIENCKFDKAKEIEDEEEKLVWMYKRLDR